MFAGAHFPRSFLFITTSRSRGAACRTSFFGAAPFFAVGEKKCSTILLERVCFAAGEKMFGVFSQKNVCSCIFTCLYLFHLGLLSLPIA